MSKMEDDIIEECLEGEEEEEEEFEDEEAILAERYKAWAEEITVVLYGFVNSTHLGQNIIDVAWLPGVGRAKPYAGGVEGRVHNLVAATLSEDAQNYIMTVETTIPTGFIPGLQGGDPRAPAATNVPASVVQHRIPHPTKCHRMSYMPQKPDVLAANCCTGDIILYNLSTHEPMSTLVGHTKEGYGLEWCPHREGLLASCSYDTTVKVWDETSKKPILSMAQHTKEVGNVSWSGHSHSILASSGDDGMIFLWDTRMSSPAASVGVEPVLDCERELGINSLCYNRSGGVSKPHILLSGDTQGRVVVRDDRKLELALTTIPVEGEVTTLKWVTGGCPVEDESRFVMGSSDGRVEMYDLSQATLPYHTEGGQGDSSLVATHFGHKSQCEAVACPPLESMGADGCVASVEGDGYLQVWRFNEGTLDMRHGLYDNEGLVNLDVV
eukprot:TRINITY_DN2341_c1_g1_i1.p1 TRINITY_DN2341_c1_g1~~TRINITY_DN2341_c1_g1_i1.p1  ORF type:complete len:439 (+),score=95.77 TRINITY_DN2341_c1_g1_i1:271-1587(+)